MLTPTTISKEKSQNPVMDYELLRKEAIAYIQRLSGKIWTDYNAHDPGMTILEVLCYAITDLGYRSNLPISDLLADSTGSLKDQFFKASEILPSKALTINDYRKLLMDVEVVENLDGKDLYAGIKNAWIEIRPSNEIPVFPDRKEKKLAYQPFPKSEKALQMGILYDVLLEFDENDLLGDLNENKISMEIQLDEHPDLAGMVIDIQVEFPRWDAEIDWNDPTEIKKSIIDIVVQYQNVPDNFELTYRTTPSNAIKIEGSELTPSGPKAIDGLTAINTQVNNFVFKNEDGILSFYLLKIKKVKEILAEAKKTLYANRNLCEDFVNFHALRVEEILICADIELHAEADVEATEAAIFTQISKFLSPQVNFYQLDEMLHRCKSGNLEIRRFEQKPGKIWLNLAEEEYPKIGSLISIVGSGNNVGSYSVTSISPDKKSPNLAQIQVSPAFPSPILQDEDRVFIGDWSSEQCTPTEKIFEGPLLKHGFIDEEELEKASRKSKIHVSDLIHLIMDIPGVKAVKSIQIANKPQDNESGEIPSKSVKWCLELAVDKNYVPRLNIPESKLVYFKEELPFVANREEVEDILSSQKETERTQKIRNAQVDFELPRGTFMDPGDYFSIQNDFPQVYGLGEDGMLPAAPGRPKKHEVKQLKAYLMVFEQFLVNYLQQLSHIRDLFSMSAERDSFGNPLIDRTYFTKSLENLVPDSADLWKDLVGLEHVVKNLAESEETYLTRRNEFLNHLLGRFAEQVVDYASLSVRIGTTTAKRQLIDDKLNLLNNYPQISSRRGQGYDYSKQDSFFHIENQSGLEDRIGALYGFKKKDWSWLRFSPSFEIREDLTGWTVWVKDELDQEIFTLTELFESYGEAALALEKVISLGSNSENFSITGSSGNYLVELIYEEEIIGESIKKDFPNSDSGGEAAIFIEKVNAIFREEFLFNARANRKSLSLNLENWYDYSIKVSLATEPPRYEIEFEFFDAPFGQGNQILTGKITEEVPGASTKEELEDLAEERIKTHIWQLVASASQPSGYQLDPDNASPYHFYLVDPVFGNTLAKSSEADFNASLASDLLAGVFGSAYLQQTGFSEIEIKLEQAVAQGSQLLLKFDQVPQKKDLIEFRKGFPILSVDSDLHEITIGGDQHTLWSQGDQVNISFSLQGELTSLSYEILESRVSGSDTTLVTKKSPRPDLEGGEVIISKTFEVLRVLGNKVQVYGGEEEKAIEAMQHFFQKEFFDLEGSHLFEHILLRPKYKGSYTYPDELGNPVTSTIEDRLLDPHFQEECECTLDDPYTCMGHLILPFWAGRFTNRDFRKFIEKKIKLETPAHVFLTVCWISPAHMEELELAWKLWHLEAQKSVPHPLHLSQALQRLIEALEQVRNVYPAGTLHDCDEDDNLDNSIILNFSSLGEF